MTEQEINDLIMNLVKDINTRALHNTKMVKHGQLQTVRKVQTMAVKLLKPLTRSWSNV
ncbi:hypothetical protein vBKpnMYP11_0134 [Klebsiella phage vB_KpnM-YP11]